MRAIAVPENNVRGYDMRADLGAMRELITLRSPTTNKDGGGYATDAPTTVASVRAELFTESGLEKFQDADLRGQTIVVFRIRYRADVRGTWTIAWQGRTYRLLEPPQNRDNRKRFLWLRCGQIEGN